MVLNVAASRNLSFSHDDGTALRDFQNPFQLVQQYESHVLRQNPNQIDMVKTTDDVQLPKMYKLSPVIEEEDFELCRNGQDILRCFVCGGAQGGWQSTLPHAKSKGGSDCSDEASKLMLSCRLV